MSRALKLVGILAVVVVTLFGTTMVFAQEDTHVFGSVFVDANMNGVWDPGEEGYIGEWKEWWDADEGVNMKAYVGTTVTLNPGDTDEIITLTTAGGRGLNEGEQDLCTYMDRVIADGPDEDEELDINPSPLRPCNGTFGLRPAGPKEMIWEVTLTPPAGYSVTSANPQYVEIADDTPVVEFGIAPTGAGGPIALLPVTGGTLLGLLAIAATLIGSGTLIVRTKSRR